MPTMPSRRPIAAPLAGILTAFPLALFSAALLADITYLNTAEVQWTNFASWLIAGACLFAGMLLAWSAVNLIVARSRARIISLLLVAVLFVLGVINSLQHAKDGWHSVGTPGLILSIVCTVLALVLAFRTYSLPIQREAHR